ncbi:hypothetical protein PV327_008887 [Microctonus hyperodae]|uniref:Pyrroline-5-carboxylate reductase n=1 Tax=Microctonus hyperodae TaxID=165561 RepID=A0AA39KVE4_MICHY|nr:hypothetical protein PV327_008887 [Microctonus hyperodae]
MDESNALNGCTIGFIGGGNMAHAIITPLLMKKIILPERVIISAKTSKTRQHWQEVYGVRTVEHNTDVLVCDIIFLAIKPQCLNTAIKQAFEGTPDNKQRIFVSIAAGITLDTLRQKIALYGNLNTAKIIRTVPNMPLSVSEGITLYSRNEYVSEKEATPVVEMFSHIGIVQEIDESLMNVAGGLAGCGPAFGYVMIEALADGAVRHGLPRDLAMKFAAQVLVGAGKMVIKTEKHPGILKDEVCSAGGTTIAGVHQLEIGAVRASLINAIGAAVNRSKELGS